jgi:hypothetical protein
MWDAVGGRQSPAALEAGLAHVAECANCAEAWRVAHELLVATGQMPAASPSRASSSAWRVWVPAAAAVVVLLGGVALDRGWFDGAQSTGDADVVRGTSTGLTTSLADGATCDRAACRLTWSDAGEGARYTVRVTTADLEPVAAIAGLAETQYTIPVDRLRALAPRADVLWQVEAVLPDGRRVSSATFSLVTR